MSQCGRKEIAGNPAQRETIKQVQIETVLLEFYRSGNAQEPAVENIAG